MKYLQQVMNCLRIYVFTIVAQLVPTTGEWIRNYVKNRNTWKWINRNALVHNHRVTLLVFNWSQCRTALSITHYNPYVRSELDLTKFDCVNGLLHLQLTSPQERNMIVFYTKRLRKQAFDKILFLFICVLKSFRDGAIFNEPLFYNDTKMPVEHYTQAQSMNNTE